MTATAEKSFVDMLPPMAPAANATEEHEITYYDGSSRIVKVSQEEIPFPKGRVLISRTDLNGIITHANEAFIELSGYTWDELVNRPHCILRHPDNPHSLFKSLWDDMTQNKKWHGYIKNLNKNGSHYWVYATAVPNRRYGEVVGYTSVRREMSRAKIEEMTAKYKAEVAAEKAAT